MHVCPRLRAWVWNADHRKLDFSGVSGVPELSLWQAAGYAGMTESKRNSAFLMSLINVICLKHNENARTRQGKMSVRLQECRIR